LHRSYYKFSGSSGTLYFSSFKAKILQQMFYYRHCGQGEFPDKAMRGGENADKLSTNLYSKKRNRRRRTRKMKKMDDRRTKARDMEKG